MKQPPRYLRALAALGLLLTLLLPHTVARSMTQTEQTTRYWAWAYAISGDYLWGLVLCESGGNPYAVGPPSSDGAPYGLAQIKPQTWAWLLEMENADTALAPNLSAPDPEERPPDAADGAPEAHILAWAISHGYSYLWACA
jgi:soluble lytic murein transglycosylase-like protein